MSKESLKELNKLTIPDDIQDPQNAYSKLTYFENNGHKETYARLAVKAIHAENLSHQTVYSIPTITSDNTIHLFKKDIITVTDLANTTTPELADVPTVTKPQAKCTIELAENKINRIPTMVSEIAGKSGVSRQQVYEAYENIVSYTHTSLKSVTPENSRDFLKKFFTTTDNTTVCNFTELPLGMRKLLFENGFESAEHVLSADTSHLESIEYSNRKESQNTLSETTVDALKQTARYRVQCYNTTVNTHSNAPQSLPAITDMMQLIKYDNGLNRREKQIRVSVQLLRGAYNLQLSREEVMLAGNIFKEAHKQNITTGVKITAVIAATHRIAMLKHNSPRPWEAITDVYNIDQSTTSTKVREITNALQNTSITVTPTDITYSAEDCIPYLLTQIPIQINEHDISESDVNKALTDADKNWTNPWGGAASAIYAVLKNNGITITQNEVSKVACISNGTIQKIYPQFMTV